MRRNPRAHPLKPRLFEHSVNSVTHRASEFARRSCEECDQRRPPGEPLADSASDLHAGNRSHPHVQDDNRGREPDDMPEGVVVWCATVCVESVMRKKTNHSAPDCLVVIDDEHGNARSLAITFDVARGRSKRLP